MRKPSPQCVFCAADTIQRDADYVAAQSTNQGKTIDWLFICRDHATDWNGGSDWPAPVYKMSWASWAG